MTADVARTATEIYRALIGRCGSRDTEFDFMNSIEKRLNISSILSFFFFGENSAKYFVQICGNGDELICIKASLIEANDAKDDISKMRRWSDYRGGCWTTCCAPHLHFCIGDVLPGRI